MTKNWGKCPKKRAAREKSIVQTYRQAIGRKALPANRQYWTLCGRMTDGDGVLQPGCELNHMVEAGLITRSQFKGAELESDIQQANRKAVPDVDLFEGDIVKIMSRAFREGWFQPGIVNLDTTHQPRKALDLLARTMDLLNYVVSPVMVVWNVVLEIRGHFNTKLTWGDVNEAAQLHTPFKAAFAHGWSEVGTTFAYKGTGRSSSKMGTIVFVRKGKPLCLPWV